jgi:hypothetical protein
MSGPVEIVTEEMRATYREAHDKIIALQNEISKLRLALSCALPVVEIHEPKLHRLIVTAVGYGPMPSVPSVETQMERHGLVLVVDNERGGA